MKQRYCKPVVEVHEVALCGIIASSISVGVYNNSLDAGQSLSRDGGAHNSTWDFEW